MRNRRHHHPVNSPSAVSPWLLFALALIAVVVIVYLEK